MAEIIIENENYTLSYHSKYGVVQNQFHKYTFGEPFRKCLDEGLKLFVERKAKKWLSDDRENSAIPINDRVWVQESWVPRIANKGWFFWAIVLPKSVV